MTKKVLPIVTLSLLLSSIGSASVKKANDIFASKKPSHTVLGPKHEAELKRLASHHLTRKAQPNFKHDLPVPIMISMEGYPVETHTVVTEDCYILEMHRIPYGKKSPNAKGEEPRPVVYLQHGLLCSSADWVMGSPEKSLGYILADAGYDVWLGNYRGNTYSRQHCSLDPSKNPFWKFSWDEMGAYDIPAMINKALQVSGQQKLFYIGHSMGTTGFMVMANKHPELQDKIILANLLAPVAYVGDMKSPIRLISPFADSLEWLLYAMGLGEFLPSNWLMDLLASVTCSEGFVQGICESVIFLMCGFDEAQLNRTLLETITHHTPAGSSTRTVVHYAQEVNSKAFSAYDHGKKENQALYGQDTPPHYSLDIITAPVATYWSLNDWLASPSDVLTLTQALPNLVDNYLVPFGEWNHLDYLWGIDAHTLVYPRILKNMESYRQ